MKTRDTISFVRASISFPTDIYQSLENLAKRKKVSLAWVVREAAERYVADEGTDVARRGKKVEPPARKVLWSGTE